MLYTEQQLRDYQEYVEAKKEIDEEPLDIESFFDLNKTFNR